MRQYYSLLAIMVILVLILPSVIQANGYCTRGGYTVATINGIFTDERGARENMDELKKINGESRNNQPIDYEYLLNPSHGAGIGDLADVVVQKMFENQKDSDYDIEEMISTASEKVQTQKLLLVAHSQGNFYANDFYDSVVKSGTGGDIPAKSLGIYAVATPADRVAGGGAWLTSDTDKVIVGLIGNFPGNTIMKPNTHIELSKDDDVLGHSFSNIYLKYRGPEIVDGIHSALDKLQNNDIQDEAKPCISTPPNTLAHRLRGATLAVTDPIASVSSAVVMGTISGVYNASVFAIDTTKDFAVNLVNVTVAVVHSGYNGLATAAESLGNILGGTQNQSSSVYAVTQKAVSQEPPHITKTPIQIKAQSSPVRLPAKEVISSKVNNIEVVGSAVVLPAQLVAAANLPVSISENTIILTAPSNIVINSKVSPAEVPVTQQAPVTDSGASVFISTSTPESHTLSEDAGQVEAVAPLPDVILPTAISDLSINVSSISNIVATSTLAPPPPPDTTLPDAPQITSPDVLATVSAFSNIVFSGTAQAGSGVYVNINGGGDNQASTTAALDGSWSMDLNLSDGLKHLDFYAVDSSGNTSSSTSRDITVDTIPPIVTLSVLECQNSLSSGSCLTLSPTLNVSWSANEDNIDHYVISKNGVTTSTYSTSTTVTAMNDSSYTFSVYAVDQAGNKSATVNQVMYVSTMPVIINELAWGGTPNHPDDEWVELYNRSSQDINLSGFILYSKTDMTPYINLTGTVRSGAYFLVEAKNTGETDVTTQAPIKNVTPDMWTSFGTRMLNTGENMLLSYASSTVDQIPYCLNWCGVPSSRTTERYDPDSSGNSSSNWSANNAVIYNGQNVDGTAITGTPGARNSLNYLVNKGVNITSNLTLLKKNSPYLIDNITQTVVQGLTLTIDPGVVIKFRTSGRLAADGNVVANGTADNPVVFTAFADDSYGGDMDGVVTTPTKGSWFGVELSNKSTGSSFDHTIFRYGGNYGTGSTYKKAMLYATQASPQISNSTFEYSKAYGAYISGSNSLVTNNIFRNNTGDTNSIGLNVDQGSPTVGGNTFSQNTSGLSVNSSSGTFSNNTFSGNTTAMSVAGPLIGSLSGNSGDASDVINLSGSVAVSGATTTLFANSMPYFLSGTVTVPFGSTLDIKEGTTIKNSVNGSASILSVSGKLNIDTSSNTGVVFQSNQSTPIKGGWIGIIMNSGSSSYIKGATIRDASTGIKYTSSPIWLENVNFTNNTTAVQSSGSTVLHAASVNFSGNTTDKNPSSLW